MSILRVGVIGAGHFGRFHAQKIAQSQRAALVGLTAVDAPRAALVGRELGGVPAMGLADLMATADAVIIATPAETHFDIAALALAQGRHVLVEKPLAATLEEADRLADVARACGRVDSEIESVDALGAAVSSAHEDIANARVRFANGCVATITASRISLKTERRMRLFSQDGYLSADFVARRLTVIGRAHGLDLSGTDGFRIDEASWDEHDVLEAEHAAFFASCLDGAPVVVDAAAGRRALAAALAVAAGMARSRALAEASGLIERVAEQGDSAGNLG